MSDHVVYECDEEDPQALDQLVEYLAKLLQRELEKKCEPPSTVE